MYPAHGLTGSFTPSYSSIVTCSFCYSFEELQYFLVMKSLADGVVSNSVLKEDFGRKEGAGVNTMLNIGSERNSETRNSKLCVSNASSPSSNSSVDSKKKLDSSSRKSSDHGSSSSPPDSIPKSAVGSTSTRSDCSRSSEDRYSKEGHKAADESESLDLRHKLRSARKPSSDSHDHKRTSERKTSRSHSRHHESSSSRHHESSSSRHHESSSSRHHESSSSSRHHKPSSSSRHHELSSSSRHHESSSRYRKSSRSQEASKSHHRGHEKRSRLILSPEASRHQSTRHYHDDSREHSRMKSGSTEKTERRDIWDTVSEVSGCTLGSLDDVCVCVDLDLDELVGTQIGPTASVEGSPAGKYQEAVDLHQESPLPRIESSPPQEKAQPFQSVPSSPSDSCLVSTSPIQEAVHSSLSQASNSPHIVHSPTSILESSQLVTSQPSSEPPPLDFPIDILSLTEEPKSPSVSSDSYSHCEVVTLASSLESHCDDDFMTFDPVDPTLDKNWLNSLQISSSFDDHDNPNHFYPNQNTSIIEPVATKSNPSASPQDANPGTPKSKSSTPEPELGTPDTLVFEASDFPELDSSDTSKCDVSGTPWFNVSDIPELHTFEGSLAVDADADEVTVSCNTPLRKCIVDTVRSDVIKKNVIRGIPHKTMKENVAPKIEHMEASAQVDDEKQKEVEEDKKESNIKSLLKEEEVEDGEITESSEDEKVSNDDDTSFVCLDDLTNHPKIIENNEAVPKRRRRSHSRSRLSASSRRNDTGHSRHTTRNERHSSNKDTRRGDLRKCHRSRSPHSAHHHKHSRPSSHRTHHTHHVSHSRARIS